MLLKGAILVIKRHFLKLRRLNYVVDLAHSLYLQLIAVFMYGFTQLLILFHQVV